MVFGVYTFRINEMAEDEGFDLHFHSHGNENKGCNQCVHWLPQHPTGVLHLDGIKCVLNHMVLYPTKWACVHTHPGAPTSPWILPRKPFRCVAETCRMRDSMQSRCRRGPTRRATPHRGVAFRWVQIPHLCIRKNRYPRGYRFFLAEDEGFEPPQTESESGVLPLHKSSICGLLLGTDIIIRISREMSSINFPNC